MGCVSSKTGTHDDDAPSPNKNHRRRLHHHNPSGYHDDHLEKIKGRGTEKEIEEESKNNSGRILTKKGGGNNIEKKIGVSFHQFVKQTEGEHVSAGWPAWLTSVAAGAVEGWLPLRSDTFERLDKIGQGTYSSVYRARDIETGKVVALKKVRFDNFQAESVKFMAREISILRKLDHPNIMKLEGIVTSRLSSNIYLVFEYMEHDLAGLLSCPDINFTESQIKCYMKQLLSGLEHCHSHGIMHRDIKTSNILVNNDGILKIADFGLANYVNIKNIQPLLTSRVVTLWYRPPELLLGATSYDATIDIWSVGCVFAELFTGRAVLKGRNEVEQLHKIFKLCGSPPDEYWNRSKLPLATMFKPQQPYDSTLHERCKDLPKTAVNLIETFLSIEPSRRGSASDALVSEYFNTKPYPCKTSSMPKYPPNKEIDAKFRDEERRRKATAIPRESGSTRNLTSTNKEPRNIRKLVPAEEVSANVQVSRRNINSGVYKARAPRAFMKKPVDTKSEVSEMTVESRSDSVVTLPVQLSLSNSLAMANLHDPSSSRLRGKTISKSHKLDMVGSDWKTNHDSCDDSSHIYQSLEQHEGYYVDQQGRAGSGPLLLPKTDSNQDNESHQADRRSRFYVYKGHG